MLRSSQDVVVVVLTVVLVVCSDCVGEHVALEAHSSHSAQSGQAGAQ